MPASDGWSWLVRGWLVPGSDRVLGWPRPDWLVLECLFLGCRPGWLVPDRLVAGWLIPAPLLPDGPLWRLIPGRPLRSGGRLPPGGRRSAAKLPLVFHQPNAPPGTGWPSPARDGAGSGGAARSGGAGGAAGSAGNGSRSGSGRGAPNRSLAEPAPDCT